MIARVNDNGVFGMAGRIERSIVKLVATDFGKIILGLVVSVILVFVIKLLAG